MPIADLILWVTYIGAAAALIVVAVIDGRTHTIPNKIVLPMYPAVIGLLAVSTAISMHWQAFWVSLACGALLWAFYYLLGMVRAGSLGFGDVKLAGVLGLLLGYLGWSTPVTATMLSFLAAGVIALVFLLLRRATLKSSIPLGPFMVGGAITAAAIQLTLNS